MPRAVVRPPSGAAGTSRRRCSPHPRGIRLQLFHRGAPATARQGRADRSRTARRRTAAAAPARAPAGHGRAAGAVGERAGHGRQPRPVAHCRHAPAAQRDRLTGPRHASSTRRRCARLYAGPSRPWLRVNFVATLDGAATGADGRSGSINTEADFTWSSSCCAELADVVVVGAGTVRARGLRPPCGTRTRQRPHSRWSATPRRLPTSCGAATTAPSCSSRAGGSRPGGARRRP